ncbi:MAG: HEPN domain-containing protein [Planktothrix sp.]
MQPTTVEDWIEIANNRAADAEAIRKVEETSVGSVYMAGYAIECSLKALLRSQNTPFPKSGREGHNLKGLWDSCGFKLSDIKDPTGAQTFFIDNWNTSLRYQSTCGSHLKVPELLKGSQKLTGWIQTQIRRNNYRKKK